MQIMLRKRFQQKRCETAVSLVRRKAEGKKRRECLTRKSEWPTKRPSNTLRKVSLNLTTQRQSHQAVVWHENHIVWSVILEKSICAEVVPRESFYLVLPGPQPLVN